MWSAIADTDFVGRARALLTESDLLFPSETGGFRSASCLDKPFEEVVTALKLKRRITPRAMRRTFQDLAPAAEVKDVVKRGDEAATR